MTVSAQDIGELAPIIAKKLWPGLTLVSVGSATDKRGTDAYLNGKPVQIKGDWTIDRTRNLYHEIYEKSVGKEDQKWRHSPAHAVYYIFVTGTFAVLTTVHGLAKAETGMILKQINATSIGFLVYLPELEEKQVKEFDLEAILD